MADESREKPIITEASASQEATGEETSPTGADPENMPKTVRTAKVTKADSGAQERGAREDREGFKPVQ